MPRKSCLTSASLLEVDLSKKPLTSIYGTILTLKSQMACNVARQVSGAYKTLQSQIDKRESEWQFLDFDPTSATFSFERDFGLSGDTLSITTLAGRRRYKILGSSLYQVGRLNCNFPSLRYIISMRFFVVLKPLALLFAD